MPPSSDPTVFLLRRLFNMLSAIDKHVKEIKNGNGMVPVDDRWLLLNLNQELHLHMLEDKNWYKLNGKKERGSVMVDTGPPVGG
jgi:hypothetical protein